MPNEATWKQFFPIVFSLSLTTLIAGMNATIFNIALPALMNYFHCDIVTIQWISSGYMLAAGVIVPCSAFFASRFGYKRTLQYLLLISLVGVVVGSFATSIGMLIGVRIVLGLAGGLFSPLTLGMIYKLVPSHLQPKAASIYGMCSIVGGALPVVVGGVLITFLSWKWLFWLFIPMIIVALVSIQHYVPADELVGKAPLDVKGFLLTVIGSFIMLYAFSNMSKWGLTPKFFGFCLVGALFMFVYVKISWNNAAAMLNLEILKYPRYNAAIIVAVIETVSMYLITFMMPLFLQKGLGYTPFIAGLIILPMSLITMVGMPIGTQILTAQGEKRMAVIGLALLIISSAMFVSYSLGLVILAIAICIRGLGLGFTNLLTTNTTMSAVPPRLSTHASAFSNWVRQMIGALTTSIAGNIVGLQLVLQHAETETEIAHAYTSSFQLVMLVTMVLLAICVPIAVKYFRSHDQMQADMNKQQ